MRDVGVYPFWFWNGKMEEKEISRQIELFKGSCCKGIVLHCRVGNAIEYMSDRWLELFRYTSLQAKAVGLKVWLYDEAGFPSGNAGEMVQRLRPDLYQKYMRFEYSGTNPQAPATHAFIPGSTERLDERHAPTGTPALRFFLEENGRHIDTFSREACDLFIEYTHEKYREAIGDLFGDPIQAVYTDDEGWMLCRFHGLAWSPVLEAEYRDRHDCELTDLLPLLVEDFPGHEAVRMDYRSLAETVFLRNFIQPQQEWCTENGLIYTGHLCGDEGPLEVVIDHFGAPMPYFKLQDIPAVDDFLCDLKHQRYLGQREACGRDRHLPQCTMKVSPLMIYKYASSIAHQFKDDLVSCECLTFLRWECSTAYMDLQMNFEIGMGVNLFTPHAFYYSVGGVAKKDCPPSYFFQQPGFDRFHEMFETWTHSAELLRRGTFHGECLVLIPIGMWKCQRGSDIISAFVHQVDSTVYNISEIEEILSVTTFELMRQHTGYDYGDERIVAGEAEIGDGFLQVGQSRYNTILFPTELEPSPEMADVLERFSANGGQIIHVDQIETLPSDITILGDGSEEILVHARDNNGFRECYLVNLSGRDLFPDVQVSGSFKLYNPRTRRAVVCRDSFPNGLVFPAGISAFILPESFECETESFEHSPFAPSTASCPATFIEAHPLNENIAVISASGNREFHLPDDVCIDHVYTEQLGDLAVQINGQPVQDNGIIYHPADICYRGIAARELFRPGHNHIDGIEREFYIAGDFQVTSGYPVKFMSQKVGLGNLAEQGYPYYWGKFEYNFTFEGCARFIELEVTGAAEIWVNGKYVETNFGAVRRSAIATHSQDGVNMLTIRLINTPQNFICSDPVSFGIYSCKMVF